MQGREFIGFMITLTLGIIMVIVILLWMGGKITFMQNGGISDLYCEESIDLYTEERFLPKILVQIGFFRSNSEVRKNRPDLVVELNELDFIDIRVGKKRLCLTVGNPITNEDETKRLNEMIKTHEEGVK